MSQQVQLVEQGPQAIILRLEDLPATPRNLERILERVRLLNERLAESGAPFRLRMTAGGAAFQPGLREAGLKPRAG
jgi:hypothetical protein